MEYFAHLDDESIDALKKACGVEVETLNVSENGSYSAEKGKAYNKVNVNVESSGGDSDFSIATCTLIATHGTSEDYTTIEGFYLANDEPTSDTFNVMNGGEDTYNAILYKGVCNIAIASTAEVTASGDIVLVDDDVENGVYYYVATVRGDCTINCIGASLD